MLPPVFTFSGGKPAQGGGYVGSQISCPVPVLRFRKELSELEGRSCAFKSACPMFRFALPQSYECLSGGKDVLCQRTQLMTFLI
jgi:hypothetical protein